MKKKTTDDASVMIVLNVTDGIVTGLNRPGEALLGSDVVGGPVSAVFVENTVPVDPIEAALDENGAWRGHLFLAAGRTPCGVRIADTGTAARTWFIEPAGSVDDIAAFSALIDVAPNALFITEVDGTILFCNKAATTIYGYSRDELIGANARMFLDPSHPLLLPAEYGPENLVNHAAVQRLHRKKDGTTIMVSILSEAVTIKGRTLMIGSVRDESSRKAVQEEMVATQKDLQFIIDSIPAVIMQMDVDLNITRANSYSRMMSGATDSPLGTNFREVNALDMDVVVDELAEVARTGKPILGTQRKVQFSGRQTVWLKADKIPHFDESGSPDGVLFFVTDITRIVDAEEQLKEHADDLVRVNRELEEKVKQEAEAARVRELMLVQQNRLAQMGELLQGIAHQWQQPLTILSLMVQDIGEQAAADDFNAASVQRNVDESLRQVELMSRTVRDFMAFLRPGEIEEQFNVLAAINEVVELNRTVFALQNISLVMGCEDCDKSCRHEHLVAKGFSGGFKQAVLTILQNARQAVAMAAENERIGAYEGYVGIALSCDASHVYISIADNGGGIPEDILDTLFDPFTSRNKKDGNGIGLTMARNIIEKNLGGRITVENIGPGARFNIALDLAAPGRKQIIA